MSDIRWRLHRLRMRVLHRLGRHHFTRCYPDGDVLDLCHWCGKGVLISKGGPMIQGGPSVPFGGEPTP